MAADPIKRNENAEIRSVYVPNEEQEKWLNHVYQRRTDMDEVRSRHVALWDKWEKQYEAWKPPKDATDWQSNIVPPFTTSVVEAELSELVDQTLRPKVTARGPEDKSKSIVLNHVLDYTWEIGNADIELYKVIKDSLVFGTGIVQEYYLKDTRKVQTLIKYDPKTGKEEYEEREINDFDDVFMETVKLQDFYIDENARSVNWGPYKANDCIRRFVMPTTTFKQVYQGPIWDQFNNVRYVKAGGDTNYYEFYQPPQGMKRDMVEVLWYWSRNPDKLVIVANDVVIRSSPNPYNHKQLPFAQAIDVMRPHQFYHKGEPELLESIQEELTTLRRQRVDRAHLDIDKMFLVSNREVLTDQDLIAEPHKAVYVDDPTASIVPLEYSQTPQTAYLEEDRLKDDGIGVTGMDVRMQGVKESGSATEAAILKESTLRRLRLKIWLLSRTLLMDSTRLRVANVIQHYSQPKLKSILGSKEEELAQRISEGNVLTIDNQTFEKQPRLIRTTDVELKRTPLGSIEELDKKGENFFEVLPEDVVPSKGSFDIKLSAEPTFFVSKPLLQQKVNDLMSHPVFQAGLQTGAIDLKKSLDKLLEINDFDPDDFSVRQERQPAIDVQTMVNLAFQENEMMASGNEVGSTPYAPREHTEIHLSFLDSNDFKIAFRRDPNIINIFIQHIIGEEEAQMNRPGTQVQAGPVPGAPEEANIPAAAATFGGQQRSGSAAAGVSASEAQAAQPARRVGPGFETEGIAG